MMPVMAFHTYLSSKTAIQKNIKYTIAAIASYLAPNDSEHETKNTATT